MLHQLPNGQPSRANCNSRAGHAGCFVNVYYQGNALLTRMVLQHLEPSYHLDAPLKGLIPNPGCLSTSAGITFDAQIALLGTIGMHSTGGTRSSTPLDEWLKFQ
jgi:hypothetical protein